MALLAEKAAGHWNGVTALLENQAARDKASPPFIDFGAVFAAVGGNIFLGNAVNDGANSRPYTSAGAHGAWLVRGVKNKTGQVAAVATTHIFERLQFDMLDARTGGLDAVPRAGDDHFSSADQASDNRADGIIAAVARTFGFGHGQLHEFLFRLVGGRDHGTGRVRLLCQSLPRAARAVVLVKDFAGKSIKLRFGFAPGIARQSGFAAGLFQELLAGKMVFHGHLREQQAAAVSGNHEQPRGAEFYP